VSEIGHPEMERNCIDTSNNPNGFATDASSPHCIARAFKLPSAKADQRVYLICDPIKDDQMISENHVVCDRKLRKAVKQ
jgi:hypothetical protein